MCIICNMPDFKADVACDYLNKYATALKAMQEANQAMLLCAETARGGSYNTADFPLKTYKRYSKIHRKMLAITTQYAKIEHEREELSL